MSEQLYHRRRELLIAYYRRHKQLPTYDDLAELFGVRSKGSIYKYVDKFIHDDLIAKSDTGRLIPTTKLYGLRVLGSVQAGFPSPAEEELVDTMSMDAWLIENPDASYLLQVSGDSMINAGIVEGDMVIVDRSKDPTVGDIVIAQVDNEWTMKYFMKRGNGIFLRAANSKYPDIHPSDELTIGGVVTSVVRKY
ncbi:MAG: LexA family transcriptional repressor [Candidatus Magasanikbacteria bacterium CG10_big_fil_rev_8_21_14_0_10_47_10]|uniref:LexA family transcriptional repressor n=1 Tax=Candidatus Magasanikbacteria bacterium CG10_big_fil_rev_8_21_14_0_10_47_10 TaxID=1974652 RepID=A0A2H0TR14_9BACT|nr:MAG: LexA family transcriptional repressor [Candidatus Magasanikbacteria bacterium CG10_big_fil_rev_8_21_14_0_10_47_10]